MDSEGKTELLSMTGQDDCVICTSGFGDGAYPAFWGVNEQDEVVSLYIDFMILVQETETAHMSRFKIFCQYFAAFEQTAYIGSSA